MEEIQAESKQHVQKPRDEREHWAFGAMEVIRGDCNRLQGWREKGEMMNISKYLGAMHVEERVDLLCAASQLWGQNQNQRVDIPVKRTLSKN